MRNLQFISHTGFFIVLVFIFSGCMKSEIEEQDTPTQEIENQILKNFLDEIESQGHNIDTTDLGIFYIVLNEGEGNYPVPGDTLEVGFAGYFPDGTLFDASDLYEENGTYEFVLGNPPNIEGWDDGMEVIQNKATVQLIIPSKFAYGSTGLGNIPPYQTLIFVVEMKNIRPV